jgi:hypothetical protein
MPDREVNGCATAVAGESQQQIDWKMIKAARMLVRFMVFLLPAKSARLLLILSIGCFHCEMNDPSENRL